MEVVFFSLACGYIAQTGLKELIDNWFKSVKYFPLHGIFLMNSSTAVIFLYM